LYDPLGTEKIRRTDDSEIYAVAAMPDHLKRILFVDDEPALLAGLQNALYKDRRRWDMVFAPGAEAALTECRKRPFDVVMSDMRMPNIDGAMLLGAIKDEFPGTVRIMLSGHCDREAIVRALPSIHQLLSKPCDVPTLREAIERGLEGADVARDSKLCAIICGIDNLPTPPDLYFVLTRLLQSPSSSVADVADVVTRDPALAAKVLQLVNCAYFGSGQKTASIQAAVSRLGTECLRYIALTASVFSTQATGTASKAVEAEQQHSMRTANLARALADPAIRDEAFASALLHDVGRIAFALARSAELAELDRRVKLGEDPTAVELELLGLTHSDVGARLLAIWGLPSSIVDAVQFHHAPGSAPAARHRLAGIVHVADAVADAGRAGPQLDTASLEQAGCAHLVVGWLAAAARVA